MFLSIRPARNQPDFRPMIEAGPKIGENLYGKCCRIGTMYENGFVLVFLQNQISLMRIFWAFHYLRPTRLPVAEPFRLSSRTRTAEVGLRSIGSDFASTTSDRILRYWRLKWRIPNRQGRLNLMLAWKPIRVPMQPWTCEA
jgi:hypothetical protein